ncbi:hypothetical protein [Ekhidna sp. To15]|uniref:hypothetical protein n=1 Tax=Ekhidna sp. To15 TaxID=3395267 RepID=UPI003F5259BD
MTRKNIVGIIILALSINVSYGQSIDEKRMNRDLKVAENILNTLASGDSRLRFQNSIESNYMPDYGVIFSIPKVNYIYATRVQGTVGYSSSGSGTYIIASSDDEDSEDEKVAADKAVKAEQKREKLAKDAEDQLKEQMTVFLVDYADLIGQLKPSDRIVVQSRGADNRIFYSGNRSKSNQNTFSAQILKSDLIAYKQGKLDREAVIKKIAFKSPEENGEIAKDLELFSTIFARLYEPDLSSTYYSSSRTLGYTSLEGFGVTFSMKVYSSTSDDGLHTIRTTGESGLTQAERNDKVNAMYPDFERSFKENLVDYGRTIKSLKADETLVMKVKLTECKGCEMPKAIEVSVKGKTLQGYDKGSISKAEAMKQITVKRKDS